MLCVADALDALEWINEIGGLPETMNRVKRNAAAMDHVVNSRSYLAYTAGDVAYRSRTSVCLTFCAPEFTSLPTEQQQKIAGRIVELLGTGTGRL